MSTEEVKQNGQADAVEASSVPADAGATAAPAVVDKGKGKRTAEDAELEERQLRETEANAKKAALGDDDEEDDEEAEAEDDDEESDEDEDAEDEDEEEAVDESFQEIDPTVIRERRTRGIKVDYTSAEALARAGLKAGEGNDE